MKRCSSSQRRSSWNETATASSRLKHARSAASCTELIPGDDLDLEVLKARQEVAEPRRDQSIADPDDRDGAVALPHCRSRLVGDSPVVIWLLHEERLPL